MESEEQNGLPSLFNFCSSKTLNHSEIEIPHIYLLIDMETSFHIPNEIYNELFVFHLKAITKI